VGDDVEQNKETEAVQNPETVQGGEQDKISSVNIKFSFCFFSKV